MTTDNKRSNSAEYDQYINNLSGRYRDRGTLLTMVREEAHEQMDHEAETEKIAPSAYSPKIDEKHFHASGEYMTSSEYASYFNAHRNANHVSAHVQDEDDDVKVPPKKKAAPEENDFKTVVFNQVKNVEEKLVKKATEAATTWFPLESKEKRAEGVKKKFPLAAIATILTMSISLMLIVGSAVMVSSASTELYALQNEAAELKAEQDDLYEKLDQKHDLREIESIARDDLGMISGDYVEVENMNLNNEDTVESYNPSGDANINFSTLLSAIASIFQ